MIRSFFKAKARFPIFSVSDLEIMRAAMRNNERDGITGFLLRDKNTYLSVVEGEDDKVESLLTRVPQDYRAFGFQILSYCTIRERQYPAWSMGYHEQAPFRSKQDAIDAFLKSPGNLSVEPVLAEMQTLGLRQIKNDQQIPTTQEFRHSA